MEDGTSIYKIPTTVRCELYLILHTTAPPKEGPPSAQKRHTNGAKRARTPRPDSDLGGDEQQPVLRFPQSHLTYSRYQVTITPHRVNVFQPATAGSMPEFVYSKPDAKLARRHASAAIRISHKRVGDGGRSRSYKKIAPCTKMTACGVTRDNIYLSMRSQNSSSQPSSSSSSSSIPSGTMKHLLLPIATNTSN